MRYFFNIKLVFIFLFAPALLLAQPQPEKTLIGHNYGITNIAFNKDGKQLYSYGDAQGGLRIWDVDSEIQTDYIMEGTNEISLTQFSKNKKFYATITGYSRQLNIYNIETKQQVFSLRDTAFLKYVNFTPDEQYLVNDRGDFINISTGKIDKTERKLFKKIPRTETQCQFKFSTDGKYLIYPVSDTLMFINLKDQQKNFHVVSPSLASNHIRGFDIDEDMHYAVLAMINHMQETSEVAVIDVRKRTRIGASMVPLSDILNIKISPGAKTFAYCGRVTEYGGPMSIKVSVRDLMTLKPLLNLPAHDNRAVFGLDYSPDENYLATGGYSYGYKLENNTFVYSDKVIAADVTVKIWDLRQLIKGYRPVQAPSSTSKPAVTPGKPQIYAVVAGISSYKKMNDSDLKYAGSDARSYYNFLRTVPGGAIPSGNIKLLTDSSATRSNIIASLAEKSERATEDDVMIFYFAGHGYPLQGNEMYLLGSDTQQKNVLGTGISQFDLEKIFNRSRAKTKIFIVDACHSGGIGLGNVRGTKANLTNLLIRKMAESINGLVLLSASSSSEFSLEDPQLRHGIFTFYLLEGLKGKADTDLDKKVSIRELYNYVYEKVSAATSGNQHPELKGNFENTLIMSTYK